MNAHKAASSWLHCALCVSMVSCTPAAHGSQPLVDPRMPRPHPAPLQATPTGSQTAPTATRGMWWRCWRTGRLGGCWCWQPPT
jgi:hypothetical protein